MVGQGVRDFHGHLGKSEHLEINSFSRGIHSELSDKNFVGKGGSSISANVNFILVT